MITLQEVGQNKSGTVVHWPSDATTAAQSASFGDITITSSALLFTCHEKIVSPLCQLVLERATDRNMDMFIGIHQTEIKKHMFFSCIGCFGPDFQ